LGAEANQCPVCGLVDQIARVSAILSAGTAVTSTATVGSSAPSLLSTIAGEKYRTTDFSASTFSYSQSDLARQLFRPPVTEPNWIVMWCFVLARQLSVFAMLGAIFGCIVGAVVSVATQAGPPFFVSVAAGAVLGPVAAYLRFHNNKRFGPIARGLATVSNAVERYDRYQRDRARWNESYYCFRDDVVFYPGESQAIRP